MQCPSCHQTWPDEFQFCPHCGVSFEAQIAESASGAVAQGPGSTAAGREAVAIGGGAAGDVLGAGARKETHYHGEEPLSPEAMREAYLHRVLRATSTLSLTGVDPKAASDSEARLELSAVYTALLTQTPESHQEMMRGATPERETRRLSALEQLNNHSRLVLLGDPGSGKSTFVNFVAMCLAGENLGLTAANLDLLTTPLPDDKGADQEHPQPWEHGPLLPVRVVLRDFAARGLPPADRRATAEHLWRFIQRQLQAAALEKYAPCLKQELLEKGGLILLDGLDEVPEAHRRREQIRQAVEDFAATFPRCRVLVTSRIYAYQKQGWRLPGFTETVLAPFSEGQIRRFVDRWYGHIAVLRSLDKEDAQGRAELLKRAVAASDRLQGLARRPLLLTLMASLHAWRGGSLPERREELYADTVDLLLDWWESQRVVRDGQGNVEMMQPSLAEWLKVDRQRVRALLNRLAYEAHAAQPELLGTADVPEGDLVGGLMRLSQNPEVNPVRLVEYLSRRAGLLLPRGVGVYTFPHRTFQEYLAACYLTDHEYPDKVAELACADPNRWREVALLAGAKAARGTASAIWLLVEALCFRDLDDAEQAEPDAWGGLLAGQALVESADLERVSERNVGKVDCVRSHLVRVMEEGRLPAVERVAAGRSLAVLGDPRPGVGLRPDGLPDIVWCEVPAGPFLMGSSDEDGMAYDREKPQHSYEILQPYGVSRYPITNAQFAAFVDAGGYREERYWTRAARQKVWREGKVKGWGDDAPREGPYDYGEPFNLSNHPVVGITWHEAVAYCLWLTEQLRKKGELGPDEEIALPTEPQWEKAARGTDGRIFPWGKDEDPDRANYDDTGIGTTSAVGCFPGGVGPYGVEDLSGNVWEWCRTKWEDSYKDYQGDDDLEGSSPRVLRGGAFSLDARYVRCAYRDWNFPFVRLTIIGFRVVVVPFSLTSEL